MTDLWAKGRRQDGDPPSVYTHCRDVYRVSCALWDTIEDHLAESMQVSVERIRARLRLLSVVSAMLHDALKANSAFQDMVRGLLAKVDQHQPVRHEILAAVFLMDDRFWGQWFAESLDEQERWMIAWAVAGHHLQARSRRADDRDDPLIRTSSVPNELAVYLSHAQINAIMESIRDLLRSCRSDPGDIPSCEDQRFKVLDEHEDAGLYRLVRKFVIESRTRWGRWQYDDNLKHDLAVLKALLIAADVAGSACVSSVVPPPARAAIRQTSGHTGSHFEGSTDQC